MGPTVVAGCGAVGTMLRRWEGQKQVDCKVLTENDQK